MKLRHGIFGEGYCCLLSYFLVHVCTCCTSLDTEYVFFLYKTRNRRIFKSFRLGFT
ncbi:hypothetical protein PAXRUDRAFT_215683 [Paxillus rubicundulus Ve08.2h10]|uniref:Uncharacterized protein n=1 Tax=Paxillus rubicundulus Ve08.2h10 TaxID=930991 RepID=A0A0D0DPH9_9AGAM|nr:hypothetical protein PAXRUDRAFT_215683 [Paxillus rubicundulus Ve08.2h10]